MNHTDQTPDQTTVTANPDGGVILHLPEFTYLDTQVWAADIGLTDDGLRALAAAVVGVLAADTRSATLDRAVAALEAHLESFFREWPEERQKSSWVNGFKDAIDELRRLAAEPQQTQTETPEVGDGPEHIDDCPGCTAFTLTGHVAAPVVPVEAAADDKETTS